LLVDTGYDGWMHDFGELTPADAVFADGRSGSEQRNLYPTLYQRAAAEVCRATRPDVVFFVRSGYTGSNQWAPAAWPGDQHCDWSADRGLGSVIAAGLSVGMCGTNTWGPDIGGFFEPYARDDSARSKELWMRWCQLGALTPIMRDHLGTKREITPDTVDLWTDAETIGTWRRYAALHNALVPYLYAYAAIAHETGVPTLRHLVLRYPDDPEAALQEDEYLLGDELLVAPVLHEGARARRVYFPPGEWVSYWDERRYAGPGSYDVPAPLEQIPLFVRAGSVLPLLSRRAATLADVSPEQLLADLTLRLYPAGAADASSRYRFHDGSTVRLQSSEGAMSMSFEGHPTERRYTVRLPRTVAVAEARADGRVLAPLGATATLDQGRWAEPDDGATWFELPAGVVGFEVRIA
jgi:alpha-glucosidase (family GH31 glycosyl hydrolase)